MSILETVVSTVIRN